MLSLRAPYVPAFAPRRPIASSIRAVVGLSSSASSSASSSSSEAKDAKDCGCDKTVAFLKAINAPRAAAMHEQGRRPTIESLEGHLTDEDDHMIPLARAVAERLPAQSRAVLDADIGQIVADHAVMRAGFARGELPEPTFYAAHAAREDRLIARYGARMLRIYKDGGGGVRTTVGADAGTPPAMSTADALKQADLVIPIVQHWWDNYKASSGDSSYGGGGHKDAGKPEPSIAQQADALKGALAQGSAADASNAEAQAAFNKAADSMFGKDGGNMFRKIEQWSKDLVGKDDHYSQANVDDARTQLQALASEGWPLIPFLDTGMLVGTYAPNPWQIAQWTRQKREAYARLTPELQAALKRIWTMFLALGNDPDVSDIANYSNAAFVLPSTPFADVPELSTWDASFDPSHIPAVPMAFATIAAKAMGAPVADVRRATVASFLQNVASKGIKGAGPQGLTFQGGMNDQSANGYAWSALIAIQEASLRGTKGGAVGASSSAATTAVLGIGAFAALMAVLFFVV